MHELLALIGQEKTSWPLAVPTLWSGFRGLVRVAELCRGTLAGPERYVNHSHTLAGAIAEAYRQVVPASVPLATLGPRG